MDRIKKIQSQLNNEQEITIISEGDLSQWIKIINQISLHLIKKLNSDKNKRVTKNKTRARAGIKTDRTTIKSVGFR